MMMSEDRPIGVLLIILVVVGLSGPVAAQAGGKPPWADPMYEKMSENIER